jgi:hypothetical protein
VKIQDLLAKAASGQEKRPGIADAKPGRLVSCQTFIAAG